jgi:hypothetical protein
MLVCQLPRQTGLPRPLMEHHLRYPLCIRGPLGQRDTGKCYRLTLWLAIFWRIVRQPWTVLYRTGRVFN